MGGVAGHLNHLFDNPDLTFKQMKDVFRLAAKGQLKTEEKVDGQNLFFSYDVNRKIPVAARNLGNIKAGGMTAEELSTKFAGRNVALSFIGGFDAFEQAVEALSDAEIRFIFGDNTDYWYNGEVLHPGATNVINYDKSTIKIHDVGHKQRDPETLRPVDFDFSKQLSAMDNALGKMQNKISDHEFDFVRSAMVQMSNLVDGGVTAAAEQAVDSAINAAGVKDGETIRDYMLARVRQILEADLPSDKLDQLILRITTGKPNLRDIKKGLNRDQLEDVKDAMESSGLILKHAIAPIETAIHHFAVEVLKGVDSRFVVDNDKEIKRQRAMISDTVTKLQSLADENRLDDKAMTVLERELQKIGDLENISTASEGVVFDYDGVTYKFTGNFAPINQILGILRYSDQQVTPVNESKDFSVRDLVIEDDGNGKRVALIPGGFKPPHAGHYDLVKHVADMDEVDEARVIIGKNSRCYKGLCITAEQSKAIWDMYTEGDPNISVGIQVGKTPVADVYDMIEDQTQFGPGDTIIMVKSDKDVGDARFDRAQSYAERKNPGVNIEQVVTPTFGGEDMGGTAVREIIAKGNKDSFLTKLPSHLSDDQKEAVWNSLAGYTEGLSALDSMLDEMSSMGAGSIMGFASAFSGTPNDHNPWKTNKKSTYKRTSSRKPQRNRGKIQKRR